MRFICPVHGRVSEFQVDGYVLGGRDYENIPFTFMVNDEGAAAVMVDGESSEEYLSKFGDWREKAIEKVQDVDCQWLNCPRCEANEIPLWVLGEDEETPEWDIIEDLGREQVEEYADHVPETPYPKR